MNASLPFDLTKILAPESEEESIPANKPQKSNYEQELVLESITVATSLPPTTKQPVDFKTVDPLKSVHLNSDGEKTILPAPVIELQRRVYPLIVKIV